MAPEQAAGGAAGPALDWYAVGVMLFELLTGELPFRGTPAEIAVAKQTQKAPRPSEFAANVPADLEKLCIELLAFDPDERPHGEKELAILEKARADAHAGASVALIVSGRSGIGKSALVDRFLAGAKGLGRGGRRGVRGLCPAGGTTRVAHFVRSTSSRTGDEIGVYHDRIRQTIAKRLESGETASWHLRLATALERSGTADSEALMIHFRGALQFDRAADFATSAADEAAEAFAFERAARSTNRRCDFSSVPAVCPDSFRLPQRLPRN